MEISLFPPKMPETKLNSFQKERKWNMTLKTLINIPDIWSSSLFLLYAKDISWIAMNTEIVTDMSFVLSSFCHVNHSYQSFSIWKVWTGDICTYTAQVKGFSSMSLIWLY